MTNIHIGGYAVGQVPIELIEPGDTLRTHLPATDPATAILPVVGYTAPPVANGKQYAGR
jgi:hypothetical protein